MTLDEMVQQTSAPIEQDKSWFEELGDWLRPEVSEQQEVTTSIIKDRLEQEARESIETMNNPNASQADKMNSVAEFYLQQGYTDPNEMARRYTQATGEPISSEDAWNLTQYTKQRNRYTTGGLGNMAEGVAKQLGASANSWLGGIDKTVADVINYFDEENAVADSLRASGEERVGYGKAMADMYREDQGMMGPAQIAGDVAGLFGAPAKVGKAKSLIGGLFGYGLPAAATDYVYTRGQGGDVGSSLRNAAFGGAVGGTVGSAFEKLAGRLVDQGITPEMLRNPEELPSNVRKALTYMSKTSSLGGDYKTLSNRVADYLETTVQGTATPNQTVRAASQLSDDATLGYLANAVKDQPQLKGLLFNEMAGREYKMDSFRSCNSKLWVGDLI